MSTPPYGLASNDSTTSLWTDPEAKTCPVFPLFRHPVYRHLRLICYAVMPVVFFVALFSGIPFELLRGLLVLYLLFLGGVFGTLVLSRQHAAMGAFQQGVQRAARRFEFLCPHCLHFDTPHYACGACGKEVEEFVIHTGGVYLNDCPYCHARVFRRWYGEGNPYRARCSRCGKNSDRRLHECRTRVLGALRPSDLDLLASAARAEVSRGEDVPFFRIEREKTLVYVLPTTGSEGEERLPERSHALRRVQAVWAEGVGENALDLAQVLDRALRQIGRSPADRRVPPLFLGESELEPFAESLLTARFPSVGQGVLGSEFLAREADAELPTEAELAALAELSEGEELLRDERAA